VRGGEGDLLLLTGIAVGTIDIDLAAAPGTDQLSGVNGVQSTSSTSTLRRWAAMVSTSSATGSTTG